MIATLGRVRVFRKEQEIKWPRGELGVGSDSAALIIIGPDTENKIIWRRRILHVLLQ